MFSNASISTLCAIVNADQLATSDEKIQLSDIIVATARNGVDRVVSFSHAARMLGYRNAQSARNLARKGKLKRVFGSGSQRAIGVTLQSLNDLLSCGGA